MDAAKIRRMSLPKKFQLLGHTIKIVAREDLFDQCECYGRWTQQDMLIEIDTGHSGESLQMHSLYHEIVHAILDLTGYGKQSKDETFVDSVGGALAQVVGSIK